MHACIRIDKYSAFNNNNIKIFYSLERKRELVSMGV